MTDPANIFDALPGSPIPPEALGKDFARIWQFAGQTDLPPTPSNTAQAIQLNLVLHLGFNTTPADALQQIETLNNFSQQHPARVIILCPMLDIDPHTEIRAKIYGICHLGKTARDTRCCEYLILHYSHTAKQFLENQILTTLSTDLPLYYWLHNFAYTKRMSDFRLLLSQATRVILDSALVPPDAMTFPWPNPSALRDLAYARILPLRQSIGQYLSAFPPLLLSENLQHLTLDYAPEYGAEACALIGWLSDRLQKCGASTEQSTTRATELPDGRSTSLLLRFHYANNNTFTWRAQLPAQTARFDSTYNNTPNTLTAPSTLLPPEKALAESLFF